MTRMDALLVETGGEASGAGLTAVLGGTAVS